MSTTGVTQEIARTLRGEVARASRNQEWFGLVIGRSQAHASQVLRGKKPLSTDESAAACEVFGLSMSKVVRDAERAASEVEPVDDIITAAMDLTSKQKDAIRDMVGSEGDGPVTRQGDDQQGRAV